MNNYNDKKLEQIIHDFEALEERVKTMADTMHNLQKDCQWHRKKITQLESQLAGFEKRRPEKHVGGSGKCNGMGYRRGGAQRERCTIRGEANCTSCGECGKKIDK